jgi:hypothetical protein
MFHGDQARSLRRTAARLGPRSVTRYQRFDLRKVEQLCSRLIRWMRNSSDFALVPA